MIKEPPELGISAQELGTYGTWMHEIDKVYSNMISMDIMFVVG
jgi:hypothetical protein